jgi:hypothetical protein
VKRAFERLSTTDAAFLASVERTTKSLDATQIRLARWAQTLNDVLGTNIHVPQLVDGRIA